MNIAIEVYWVPRLSIFKLPYGGLTERNFDCEHKTQQKVTTCVCMGNHAQGSTMYLRKTSTLVRDYTVAQLLGPQSEHSAPRKILNLQYGILFAFSTSRDFNHRDKS